MKRWWETLTGIDATWGSQMAEVVRRAEGQINRRQLELAQLQDAILKYARERCADQEIVAAGGGQIMIESPDADITGRQIAVCGECECELNIANVVDGSDDICRECEAAERQRGEDHE